MAGIPITDVDSFDVALTANPAEPRSSAVVLGFLQSHANRTRHVYERSGARTAATITALRAVTGMTAGHVRTVPGYGRFIYQSAALPDAPPAVVVATAGGCWVRDDISTRSRRLPTPAAAVHRWRLSEASGAFVNEVSAGQNMAATGTPPQRAQRAPIGRGIIGNSGVAGVGAVATADAVAGPITVSCWVILGAFGSVIRLVARPRTGAGDCTWRLDVDAAGKLSAGVRIAGAGAETAVLGATVLPQGVPLYLALVYHPDLLGGSGTLNAFANGVQQPTSLGTPALGGLDHGAGTTVCVGGGDGSSGLYSTVLEDVLIEQALVTSDELRDRYLRGIGLVEEG